MDEQIKILVNSQEDSQESHCTIASIIDLARESHEEFLSFSRTIIAGLPVKKEKVRVLGKRRPIYLNSHQVLRLLNISSPTLKRYRSAGIIGYSKINGCCKYLYSDVIALLDKKISHNTTTKLSK